LLNASAKNLVINTTAGHEVIPDAPGELREGKKCRSRAKADT